MLLSSASLSTISALKERATAPVRASSSTSMEPIRFLNASIAFSCRALRAMSISFIPAWLVEETAGIILP